MPWSLTGLVAVSALVAAVVSYTPAWDGIMVFPPAPTPPPMSAATTTVGAQPAVLTADQAFLEGPTTPTVSAATCLPDTSCVAAAMTWQPRGVDLVRVLPGIGDAVEHVRVEGLPAGMTIRGIRTIVCRSVTDCWLGGAASRGPYVWRYWPFLAHVQHGVATATLLRAAVPGTDQGVVTKIACPTEASCIATGLSAGAAGTEIAFVATLAGGHWLVTDRVANATSSATSCSSTGCHVLVAGKAGRHLFARMLDLGAHRAVVRRIALDPRIGWDPLVPALDCTASGCAAIECGLEGQVTDAPADLATYPASGPATFRRVPTRAQNACSFGSSGDPLRMPVPTHQLFCATVARCTVVALGTLETVRWDGARWSDDTVVGSPPTGGTQNTSAGTLSCESAQECVGTATFPVVPQPQDANFSIPGVDVIGNPSIESTDVFLDGSWTGEYAVVGSRPFFPGDVQVNAMSCSTSTCALGGYYTDRYGYEQAFVAEGTGARWGALTALPQVVAWNAGHAAAIVSVACAGTTCDAVGNYTDASSLPQGFAVTYQDGSWQQPATLAGASGSFSGQLDDVRCAQQGDCVAMGSEEFLTSGTLLSSNYQYSGEQVLWAQRQGAWGSTTLVDLWSMLQHCGNRAIPCTIPVSGVPTPPGVVADAWDNGIFYVPLSGGTLQLSNPLQTTCEPDGLCVEVAQMDQPSSQTSASDDQVVVIQDQLGSGFSELPGLVQLEHRLHASTSSVTLAGASCAAGSCTVAGSLSLGQFGDSITVASTWRDGRWGPLTVLRGLSVDTAGTLGSPPRAGYLSCYGPGDCVLVGSTRGHDPQLAVVVEHDGRFGAVRREPVAAAWGGLLGAVGGPVVSCAADGTCTIAVNAPQPGGATLPEVLRVEER